MGEVTYIHVNNSQKIPVLGLGTWQRDEKFSTETISSTVSLALDVGYRYFDTAQFYGTERSLGIGIKTAIEQGKITRNDVFITTKLFANHNHRSEVVPYLRRSLEDLKLDFVDLFLIHWPCSLKSTDLHEIPVDSNRKVLFDDDVDYVDTWKGMEDALDLGLTKNIGVCNFNKRQLERLLSNCRTKPANVQIEANLFFQNSNLVNFCLSKGITVTAYSSLYRLNGTEDTDSPDLDLVKEIARHHGKTVQQVALKFQLQRGLMVIPKTNNESRLRENFELFDFKLSDAEMESLKQLERNTRSIAIDVFKEAKEYPFTDPY